MSKLANLIEAKQTGRIKLLPYSPVIQVFEDWNSVAEPLKMGMVEYRLEVRFGTRGYANQDNGQDLVRLKDMTKRQILEEVFGEFRPMLRKLERAVYNLEWDDARVALQELELEMRY